RQPLVMPDGDLWLVGNGEIYNHDEVASRIGGAEYSSRSDNEVALHLLANRGPEALGELEGMFALLTAGPDGSFMAARDPVGIKPLYWARADGRVQFASEMAAFDAELQALVEVFPPGHYWMPEAGLERFAEAVPQRREEPAAEATVEREREQTRQVLIASVKRQMMGDVPVGVFLSGGLDSTLVAAIAARRLAEREERLQTFAVGTEGSPDLLAARVAAEHLGTEHHERIYTAQEALDAVPAVVRAIEHFDPSLVRSAVPNFFLAEMTARHVKVVLTGEGADELFAGYEYLRDFSDPERLHAEITRTVEGLHNLNLQRCDRVTMAHGLEARVPFLDRQVIEFALSLPAKSKLAGPDQPEKRLLREAFSGWLPDELLWRKKSEFGDGSGAASVLTAAMEDMVGEVELERERDTLDPPLRTREELAYFRIFKDHLPGVRPEHTVGRFATA
ncbi:MAG: asparagine synthetase B, partial [Actinobacteria bacterium]|nr:asparagine synthetase B [Actinomycetota bacterium]